MSDIQDILNEFMPCGGTVCPGCVTGCHLADSNVPDVDRMADAIIEFRALVDTLTRERDEARSLCDETTNLLINADREADTLRTQLAAARVVGSSEKSASDAPPEMNHMEATAWAYGYETMRAALTAALSEATP
jgi:hypothetical protein